MNTSHAHRLGLLIFSCGLTLACSLEPVTVAKLTVTLSGLGEGTVAIVDSDAIICPDNCSEAFPLDTSIELVATPFAGFQFDGFDGDCKKSKTSSSTPTARNCKIKMNEDREVSASFSLRTHDLNVQSGQHGRVRATDNLIDCVSPLLRASKCSANLNFGRRVILVAEPDPGYRLVSWGGDCLDTKSCGLTITKDRMVSAEFEEDIVTIQITKTGTGTGTVVSTPAAIDCGSICSSEILRDQPLLLTASADPGSRFVGWSGLCTGEANCALVTRKNENNVSAQFVLERYTLTVSIDGQGQVQSTPTGINCGDGNTSCSAIFVSGTEIILETTAADGFELDTWSESCAGNASCLLKMDDNKSAHAAFLPALYDLSINVAGVGQGTVTSSPSGIVCPSNCQATFPHGTAIQLIAEPARGSRFSAWTGACSGDELCDFVITDFDSATAIFDIQRHDVLVNVVGLGSGRVTSDPIALDCPGQCSARSDHGISLTLQASSNPGSVFVGWEGACEGTGLCQISANASKSVAARFTPEFSLITVRQFTLGSTSTDSGNQANEQPQVQVAFSGHFWMKKTEVTHGEWEKVMGTSVSSFAGCGDNCPIETVSFEQATQYLNRLSDLENYPRCYSGSATTLQFTGTHCLGYRLPTAAEWEYAARAGSSDSFSGVALSNVFDTCGNDPGLESLGWYCDNAGSSLHDVALKSPNNFGLYDMHGNVAEWTEDHYAAASYSLMAALNIDPIGSTTTSLREVRGGHWQSLAKDCRSATRVGVDPSAPANTIGFRPVRSAFSRVPAGHFLMGSDSQSLGHLADEAPQHTVFLTRPFWVQQTETTQAEYAAVQGSNPSVNNSCGDYCPVEQVSIDDSVAFLNQRSTQAGLNACYGPVGGGWNYLGPDCDGYRLLSEAEWERAARANTDTSFFAGDISSLTCADTTLNQVAWYCANSSSSIHGVAQKPANDFGLYDMHGNIAEWVNDYYSSAYYTPAAQEDPSGPVSGSERVVRGGYYNANAAECRSSARNSQAENLSSATVGLRVARSACRVLESEATTLSNAPLGRTAPEFVWTKHEVLILGGQISGASVGMAAFNPYDNSWSTPNEVGAPELNRRGHGVAWTGREALIWGGESSGAAVADGGAYLVGQDTWRPIIGNLSSPSPRSDFVDVWTGTEWFVWGGKNGSQVMKDGARYEPSEDTWLPISRSPLAARSHAAAVWTSTTIMVLGGHGVNNQSMSDYAFYDPTRDQWSGPFSIPNCSGKLEAFVVGGFILVISETGWCRYELSTGNWSSIPIRPGGRLMFAPGDGVAIINNAELLIFGGSSNSSDGVLDAYEPKLNRWRSPLSNGPSDFRFQSNGIWMGCRLFLWSDDNARQSGWLFGP